MLHQLLADEIASWQSGLDKMKGELLGPLAGMGDITAEAEIHIAAVEVSAKQAVERLSQSSEWNSWTLEEDVHFQYHMNCVA